MFSVVIVVLQLFFIIMIGAFYRSHQFSGTYSDTVTFGLMTILGFVFMNSIYRKLSLFSLVLLLFISFISIEVNMLFYTFWKSCFSGFNKQTSITVNLLVNSVYGALGVMITCMDFLSLFQYWQIFAFISFIMTLGYSFCSALILYGLDTYDGGNASSVFLYSGVVSLIIWLMSVRGKISILQHKKSQSYLNYTFSFIGVAIALFSWPILNIGGSLLTYTNTELTSSLSLSNSVYINTLSALGVALIMSSFLSSKDSQSQKLKPKTYIQCFINAGIIVSSFNDVSLYPVVGMIMSLVSTVLTIVIDKNLVSKTDVRNQSDFKMVIFKFSKIIYRIIWSFVGVCIGAMVVKGRDSSSLYLLSSGSHGSKAGLMVAGWIIVLIIGVIFGLVSAVAINVYLNYRLSSQKQQKVTKITDQLFFDDLSQQIFPIYKDILQVQPDQQYVEDLTRRMLKQTLIHQQKVPLNIYDSNKRPKPQQNAATEKVQKQTLVIKNDFAKSTKDFKDINVSSMKKNYNRGQQPIATQNVHMKRQGTVTRQKVVPDYSPINQLKGRQSMFQSIRPAQSKAVHPQELKTIPSSSRMVQIYAIQQENTNKKPQNQLQLSKIQQQNPNIRKKLTFQSQIQEENTIQKQELKRKIQEQQAKIRKKQTIQSKIQEQELQKSKINRVNT